MAYNAPGTTATNDGPPAWTPPQYTQARPPAPVATADTPPGGQPLTTNQQQSLAAGKILPAPPPVFKPYKPPTPWGGTRAGSDGAGSWVGLSQKPAYPRNPTPQPAVGTAWGQGSFNQRAQQAADTQAAKGYMNKGAYDNPQFQEFFNQLNAAKMQQDQMGPVTQGGTYVPSAYTGGMGSSYSSGGGK